MPLSGVASESALFTITKNLHCAQDQPSAAQYIRRIQQLDLFPPNLPNENRSGDIPFLRATTLDNVLSALYRSANTYPQNKDLVERTVIEWNFCHVIDNNRIYDVSFYKNRITKIETGNSQHQWLGFKAFGLISSDQDSFTFTTPYQNNVLTSLADLRLLKTYIKHCLPHPDDSHLYRDYGRNFISRIVPTSNSINQQNDIPWKFECADPKPKEPEKEELEKQNIEIEITQSIETVTPTIIEKPITQTIVESIPEAKTPVIAAAKSKTIETIKSEPIPITEPDNKFVTTKTTPLQKAPTKPKPVETNTVLDRDLNYPAATVATGSSAGNAVHSTHTSSNKGFSGSISLQNKSFIAKNTSLNFSIAYKPIPDSYWFIRSAFNFSQQDEPLSYSWGIGYDDWHPGTWGIQLNHWGPLKSGDGLDFENAVAEISYKVDSDFLKNNRLSSSIALSKPISGDPSLSWGWSWNPYSDWFIRSTLIKPALGQLNWSYGFGYTRYTKNSLSLEYNNWGVNQFAKTNFKKNGQLSLIYRWAF